MTRDELIGWLKETDETRLQELWDRADAVRREHVGDDVYLRGIIEFSNYCSRRCAYCGLNALNDVLPRYRMAEDEIMECVRKAVSFGYGTVVLQSGEDRSFTAGQIAELIYRIKAETPLAVTLSLGERTEDELAYWREAGADRYLLKFETSNPALYAAVHPPLYDDISSNPGRIELLKILRSLGYETGSGVMIGLPGQTYADLARDIELFAELELEMIGAGPFIPHPHTPLAQAASAGGEQVPNTELMTYKVTALTRLTCPDTNLPTTTALATLNGESGRELGLQRGANVIMPSITPPKYRIMYEIYPSRVCVFESADDCATCITERIHSVGRIVGAGPGASPKFLQRQVSLS